VANLFVRNLVLAALAQVVLCGGPVRSSTAASLTLAPAKDNTLFSAGTTSNGAGPVFFSGRTGVGGGDTLQRAVFKFNLCEIPRGSTINSVRLTLYLERSISAGQTHRLHRLLADWGEGASSTAAGDALGGGMGVPAQPGDATWLVRFFPDFPWAAAGGDFWPILSASQVVGFNFGPPAPYNWGSTPEMVADVQGWVDDPSVNFGWLLLGDEAASNTSKKFASREADPAFRPQLVVDFTPPAEPCAADCNAGPANGSVDINDLLKLLADWGEPCSACDLDCDNLVEIVDLLDLLAQWGACGG
jgi:hypothetical protein